MHSCGVKKQDRNGLVARVYHNVTARYNGYFNGVQLFDESIKSFETGTPARFDRLLPVIILPDQNQARSLATNLDEVIRKASTVIDRHPYSKWTKYSYQLVGKSYLYKGDPFNAALSFSYVFNTYNGFPELQNEALAWLMLAYHKQKKDKDAETTYDFLNARIDSSTKYLDKVYPLIAQYLLEKNRVEDLKKLLPILIAQKSHAKDDRIRYSYLLAQLYERDNETALAATTFRNILTMSPAYEYIFQTRISIARLFNPGTEGEQKIVEELQSMLKEEKNREFQDQLFFALAGIDEQKGRYEKAIETYSKSAQISKNSAQKGRAYEKIAVIYYNKLENYIKAQRYYDSTANVMPKDDFTYAGIKDTRDRLSILVENLDVISREDSLQSIANLSDLDREQFIAKLVDTEVNKIQERQQRERQALSNPDLLFNTNTTNITSTNTTDGTWYFYNNNSISLGFSEFVRRWGSRPSEDNWRRKDKQQIAFTNDPTNPNPNAGPNPVTADGQIDTESIKNRFLAGLPLTAALKDTSNKKIETAIYNIGYFYRDEIADTKRATEYFEKLLTRFPNTPFKVEAYYELLKINNELKNQDRAAFYEQKILNEFPGSVYANIISNPEPQPKENFLILATEFQYESAFEEYLAGNFENVLLCAAEFDKENAEPEVQAKFALLKAMAIGHLQPLAPFETALKTVMEEFPNTEIANRAIAINSAINLNREEYQARNVALIVDETGGLIATAQRFDEMERLRLENEEYQRLLGIELRRFKSPRIDSRYKMLISIYDNKINLNSTRLGISRFNRKHYRQADYKIVTTPISKELQLLTVQSFENPVIALEYYEKFISELRDIIRLPSFKYELFLITEENLNLVSNRTEMSNYSNYFRVVFENEIKPFVTAVRNQKIEMDALATLEADRDKNTQSLPRNTSGNLNPDEKGNTNVINPKINPTIPNTGVAPILGNREVISFAKSADEVPYYLVIAVPDREMNLNAVRLGISQFNRREFTAKPYRHNSKTLPDGTQMVYVSTISNKKEASLYWTRFNQNSNEILRIGTSVYQHFIISADNFEKLTNFDAIIQYSEYYRSNF